MRRMWLAAIPALALACATSKPEEQKMSGTARTQSQAQQKLQRAADAQKHALQEQQKAEKAQQDVVNAQKALADAQAKLAGQRSKAEQAQREAQQAAQEAQQEAQRDQQRASQMQRQDAQQQSQLTQQNQQAWMQAKDVRGQAVTASRDEVLVRSSDQGELRLKVNNSTAISVDGKMASAEDIKPGQDVRASYQVVDGQPTALRIEAKSDSSMPSSEPKK